MDASPSSSLNDETKELLALEEELRARQQDLEQKRKAHEEKKKREKAARLQKLTEKQAGLDQKIEKEREARLRIRDKLIEKRTQEKSHTKESMQAQEELWELTREHQLDTIAMKKIELDEIQAKKKALEDALKVRVTTLDEIDQERRRRGQSKVDKMKNLLEKANHLQEALDNETDDQQLQLAMDLFDKPHEDQNEIFRLADELTAARQTRYENDTQERLLLQRQLNQERMDLHRQQQDVAKRKKLHARLQRKGVDFLAALELGDGPPKEFILANLVPPDEEEGGEEEGSDEDDATDDIDAMLEEIEGALPKQTRKLRMLQVRMETLTKREREFGRPPHAGEQPYDGSLGAASYSFKQQAALAICRAILLETVVERALDAIFGGRSAKDLVDASYQLAIVHNSQMKRMEQRRYQDAVRHACADVVREAVEEEVASCHDELVRVDAFVSAQIKKFVLDATLAKSESLQSAPSRVAYRRTIQSAFTEMQRRRAQKKWAQRVEDCTGQPLKQTRAFSQRFERMKRRRQSSSGGYFGASDDDDDDDDDDDEEDVQMLAVRSLPSQKQCRERCSGPGERADEREYWEHTRFVHCAIPLGVSSTNTKAVADCCSMSLSPDGHLLAVGSSAATIAVIDLRIAGKSGPMAIRVQRPDALPPHLKALRGEKKQACRHFARVKSLCWSMDGTQLLAVYGDGTVWVWNTVVGCTLTEASRTRARRSIPVPSSKFVAQTPSTNATELCLAMVLGPRNLTRPVLELEEGEGEGDRKGKKGKKKKEKKKEKRRDGSEAGGDVLAGLACSVAAFHPALTLFAKQPCVVLGTADGSVVKWNARHNSEGGARLAFGACVATSEPPDPDPFHSYDPGINNAPRSEVLAALLEEEVGEEEEEDDDNDESKEDEDEEGGEAARQRQQQKPQKPQFDVRREFFVSHKAELMYLGFAAMTPSSEAITMVSVDVEGKIKLWPYSVDHFSGFGWFVPGFVGKLDLRLHEEKGEGGKADKGKGKEKEKGKGKEQKAGKETSEAAGSSGSDSGGGSGGGSGGDSGRVLQVEATRMRTELVLLVHCPYSNPSDDDPPDGSSKRDGGDSGDSGDSGGLHLFVVRLSDSNRELMLAPIRIRVQGGRGGRGQGASSQGEGNGKGKDAQDEGGSGSGSGGPRPRMCVSSVVDTPGSDYVYLHLPPGYSSQPSGEAEVQVYSLATMQLVSAAPCRAPQPAGAKTQTPRQQGGQACMAISHRHDFLVVGSSNQSTIDFYRIEDGSSSAQKRRVGKHLAHRRAAAPMAMRARGRDVRWDVDGEHPPDYCKLLVWEVIEAALARV